MVSTKRLTTIAVLVALAIVLHLFEALIPIPFPIPGVKLGLANIVTLLALVLFDSKTAFLIVILRTVLGSLLSGTLLNIAFFLSFSGAIAATCLMALLLQLAPAASFKFRFSLLGISVAGAAAHNLGQLAMAALLIKHTGIFYYLPIMLLSSVPTGFLTGLLLRELLNYLQSSGQLDDFLI
ncbi:MAG: Gx transporter family protein [Syntrophomonadaceae bacterium]|nr:Gx transporter family protein [Syntrophomonadaceae bacterium]